VTIGARVTRFGLPATMALAIAACSAGGRLSRNGTAEAVPNDQSKTVMFA
jgi:hypothetical protein